MNLDHKVISASEFTLSMRLRYSVSGNLYSPDEICVPGCSVCQSVTVCARLYVFICGCGRVWDYLLRCVLAS